MSGIPVSAIHAYLDRSSGMARGIFRAAPLSVDVLHAAWGIFVHRRVVENMTFVFHCSRCQGEDGCFLLGNDSGN